MFCPSLRELSQFPRHPTEHSTRLVCGQDGLVPLKSLWFSLMPDGQLALKYHNLILGDERQGPQWSGKADGLREPMLGTHREGAD